MSLRPIHDKVLVSPVPSQEKTRGGIIIPLSAKQRNQVIEAVVVAVGPGRLLENGNRFPLPVNVGDRVLVSRHSGTAIKKNGKTYLFLLGKDILAVLGE